MQKKALDSTNNYEKEVLERIRRMNIVAADLEVKGTRKAAGIGASNIPGVGDIWTDEARRQPASNDAMS